MSTKYQCGEKEDRQSNVIYIPVDSETKPKPKQ